MNTATEEAINNGDKERRKRVFEYQIEAFIETWKPYDRRNASRFETELIMLIRQVYADAQEPILEQLTKTIQCYPLMFNAEQPPK